MRTYESTVRASIKRVVQQRDAWRARLEDREEALRGLVREGVNAGLTPTELAELAGVSRYTIYVWLGRIDNRRESA